MIWLMDASVKQARPPYKRNPLYSSNVMEVNVIWLTNDIVMHTNPQILEETIICE